MVACKDPFGSPPGRRLLLPAAEVTDSLWVHSVVDSIAARYDISEFGKLEALVVQRTSPACSLPRVSARTSQE